MLDVVNGISTNMIKNQYTGLILDLKKAFVSVSHSILLRKLEHYDIGGSTPDLFSSYLTDRKQYISVNGACASAKIESLECHRDRTLAHYSSQHSLMTSLTISNQSQFCTRMIMLKRESTQTLLT